MQVQVSSKDLEYVLHKYIPDLMEAEEGSVVKRLIDAVVNAPDPRPMPETLGFKLERPLVTFDLETTGLDVTEDRIISLGYHKYWPTNEVEPRIESGVWYFNPGRPIPKEASAVHGITDAQVEEFHWPYFWVDAPIVASLFDGSDVCTFNGNAYDVQLLSEEFGRCGIGWPKPSMKSIDVRTLYHKKEGRTLADAHRFYLGEEMVGNHDALADTQATFDVLLAMLARYPDLGEMSVADLHNLSCYDLRAVDLGGKISVDDEGDYIYTFGKHKGQKIKQNPGYARWMLDSNFPANTKLHLETILDKCCRSYM